jgi:hypothetical protein
MAAAAWARRASGAFLFFPNVKGFHEECVNRARQQLGEQEFQAAWNEGTSLSFDDAVTMALQKDA